MSRVIVVYSPGAVLLRDLVLGLDWCTSVMFVVRPDLDARARSVLEGLGQVVVLDGAAGEGPVLHAAQEFRPDGIVTFSEELLGATSELGARLGLPCVAPAAVAGLTDKTAQRAVLREAGVDDLRSAVVNGPGDWPDAVSTVGLPLVLKPTRGAGSRNTVRIDDAPAGASHLRDVSGTREDAMVAEEYLVGRPSAPFGDYVSIESLVIDGEVHHLGVTGKMPQLPPFRETAQFFPSQLTVGEESEVLDLVERALAALRVDHSMTHTEVKLTAHGPRIIEVNGRAGGYITELYGRALGVDVVELVTRLACGERPALPTASRDRVLFQTFHQPPLDARRLVSVDGVRQVARHPSVRRFDRLVEAGAPMPSDGRSFDLDLICGEAATHADLIALLRELGSGVTFVFETAEGERTVNGSDLASPREP